jgi:hypothetical protein
MASREYIVDQLSQLPLEDLEALEEYLERLQAAGDDPFLRAMVRASMRTPEMLTPEEEASIDASRANPNFIAHDDVKRQLLGESE